MRNSHINSHGARTSCTEEQVCRPISGSRDGLFQRWGPTGQLRQPKQTVAQVVVATVGPIARATQGMVSCRVHGFATTGTH